MTANQLFAAITPELALQILEEVHASDKDLYRVALHSTAQTRKVRPVFLERQPRAERHRVMVTVLKRPDMAGISANVLSGWLVQKQSAMLTEFLDSLQIKHEKGVVEDLPETVDEAALKQAVEKLLEKYPHEVVALYLWAFKELNEARWPALQQLLESDPRLRLNPAKSP